MADTDGVYLIFLLMCLLILSSRVTPLPEISDPTFISECLQEHNDARANVHPPASNMRYMTWDEGLAVAARAWGSKCLFEHNNKLQVRGSLHPVFPTLGENIWAAAPPSSFTVKSAVKRWVDEVQDYNYYTQSCTNVCGHYTQVVWADSYKVGCAVIECPGGVRNTKFSHRPGVIFVCNYATPGNYVGERPYKEGASCSLCGGERCEKKLCRNSTRDATIRNPTRDTTISNPTEDATISLEQTQDRGASLRVCDGFCTAVLIIRPVSLILIPVSVYSVQQRCPNLFAYIN